MKVQHFLHLRNTVLVCAHVPSQHKKVRSRSATKDQWKDNNNLETVEKIQLSAKKDSKGGCPAVFKDQTKTEDRT